ncbi:hypothetical protein SAMN04488136_101164 [Vibrio xiamenensis]|uniref:Uncharacterized protein n=2 Tax=Vibrio xiamenensis TaxID=861298 RepID=A0A1G7W3K2_9VIBR|nr:hypothetical protein SAMN04488136_101164 [Vibrio xiamenensis]
MIKPTLLASTVALVLTGCGGGGGGGGGSTPSVSYFKANFVYLDSVAKDQNGKGNCRVYDYDYDSESETPEIPTYKVIGYTASPLTGYSIVVHDSDGSVVSTYTKSDWGTANFYRIKQSEVPSGGYVSFVVKTDGNSYQISTYSKDLLPDTFSMYAGGSYTGGNYSSASTSCITGGNTTYGSESGNFLPIGTSDLYGFNTYGQDLDDLTNYYSSLYYVADGGISFYAPQDKAVLGVEYSKNGDDIDSLVGYKFLSLSDISATTSVELTDVDDTLDWTLPDTSTVTLSQANIHVYKSTTGAVLWQPLTTSADGTYGYATAVGDSNYYLNLEGTYGDWSFSYADVMSNPGIEEDATSTISDVVTSDSVTLSIASCSLSAYGSCIDIATDAPDFSKAIQRVEISNKPDSGSVNQVIYSDYSDQVPIFSFDGSNEEVSSILVSGSTQKIYLSLLAQNGSTLNDAFLYNHQDLNARLEPSVSSFQDAIPMLSSFKDHSAQQNLFKYKSHILLQASSD